VAGFSSGDLMLFHAAPLPFIAAELSILQDDLPLRYLSAKSFMLTIWIR